MSKRETKRRLRHLTAQAIVQWWRLARSRGWRLKRIAGATLLTRVRGSEWDGFDKVLLERMERAEEGGPVQ